jgi:hypothetical protein
VIVGSLAPISTFWNVKWINIAILTKPSRLIADNPASGRQSIFLGHARVNEALMRVCGVYFVGKRIIGEIGILS